MTLNLDRHKDNLVSAWKEVMDEKNPTNWALFGYDGLTFDLNLISKGDGGIEELTEDFNSGKIMYALTRVKVKEKNIEKIVLINWQGEGAPLSRKGMAANHVGRVQSFFKGIHVTINARTDEDVELDTIHDTVSKATAGEGVKHSTMAADTGSIGPVGTCYTRVDPKADINSAAKDEFWRLEEQEEERRKRDEQSKLRKTYSQNEVKLLRRESQEYFNERDESNNVGSKSLSSPSSNSNSGITNSSQKLNNGTSSLNSTFNSVSAAAVKASTPMKNTSVNSSSGNSGDLVRNRIKSFDHGTPRVPVTSLTNNSSPNSSNNSKVISSSNSNGNNASASNNGDSENGESLSVLKRRQLFENGATRYTPIKSNPAQEIKLAQEKEKAEQLKQKQKESSSNNASATASVNNNNSTPPPPTTNTTTTANTINNTNNTPWGVTKADNNDSAFNTIAKSPTKQQSAAASASVIGVPQVQKSVSPVPQPTAVTTTSKAPNNSHGVISSVSSYEHEPNNTVQDDDSWSSNNNDNNKNNGFGVAHAAGDNNLKGNNLSGSKETESLNNGALKSDQNQMQALSSGEDIIEREDASTPTIEITAEMGLCARALYDYQAADDSEISFDPGEIVTNIEMIDEGWWEGMGPQGIYGLFPSNYVELLN